MGRLFFVLLFFCAGFWFQFSFVLLYFPLSDTMYPTSVLRDWGNVMCIDLGG
jgi:hypothetical protein